MKLSERLSLIVGVAEINNAQSDFLGCARALQAIHTKLKFEMDAEDLQLHKMGVGWDSAHTKAYQFSRDIVKMISKELPDVPVVVALEPQVSPVAAEEASIAQAILSVPETTPIHGDVPVPPLGDSLSQTGTIVPKRGWF